MTMQEEFETVARHLFAQGKRAVLPEGSPRCAYRTKDGLKCAIGALIPDELYNETMESWGFEHVFDDHPELADVLTCGKSFYAVLQTVHDFEAHWRSSDAMRRELRAAADQFNLDATFLDTLSFEDR